MDSVVCTQALAYKYKSLNFTIMPWPDLVTGDGEEGGWFFFLIIIKSGPSL